MEAAAQSSLLKGWLGCVLLLLVAACGGGGDASAQLTFSPSALPPPAGTTGVAYPVFSFAPPAGGVAPFTWTDTGILPQGMSVSSDGRLSGTPQTAGKFVFTLMVTDSSSPRQGVTEAVTLLINDSPLRINTAFQPPGGTQSTPYAGFEFVAGGGSAPFKWSVAAGALPAGLTLNSNGTLSGTPSGSGSSTFTVTVTDSAFSQEKDSEFS